MQTISEIDAAYVAGLFDGEGWVTMGHSTGIRKSGQPWDHWYVRIGIKLSTPHLLEFVQKLFGGVIDKAHGNHLSKKPLYSWNLVKRDDILHFASILSPHLKLKRPQIELAVKFHKDHVRCSSMGRGHPILEAEYVRRGNLRHQLRVLNGSIKN